jgi:hypothetical protein
MTSGRLAERQRAALNFSRHAGEAHDGACKALIWLRGQPPDLDDPDLHRIGELQVPAQAHRGGW